MRVHARQGFVDIQMLEDVDEFIRDMHRTQQSLQYGMNVLAMILSHAMVGFAQKLSGGPVDPRMTMRGAAGRIPVRRITLKYYTGWKAKRVAPNVWLTYNDSREAWFIEFGTARMERRPIMKIALGQTWRWLETSKIGWAAFDLGFGYMYGAKDAARRYEARRRVEAAMASGRGFATNA